MFGLMTQQGGRWKGITKDGIEVSITDAYFKDILAKQTATVETRPDLADRNLKTYGVGVCCFSPEWWNECYHLTDYAVGPNMLDNKYTWIKKPGYTKLMYGKVVYQGFSNVAVGTKGTLIFRKLSEKQLKAVRDAEAMLEVMQGEVEDYFQNEFGLKVAWD